MRSLPLRDKMSTERLQATYLDRAVQNEEKDVQIVQCSGSGPSVGVNRGEMSVSDSWAGSI